MSGLILGVDGGQTSTVALLATRAGAKEVVAIYTADQAVRAAWLGHLTEATNLADSALKIEHNRFKQYFTGKQQTVQRNSQARGIYADNTGRVAANIWWHTFLQ